MKFEIYAGLGGGFGGANFEGVHDFDSRESAEKYAYDLACDSYDSYDSYEGLHGIKSYSDIKHENPDWDNADIITEYTESRESWLDYYVKLVKSEVEPKWVSSS